VSIAVQVDVDSSGAASPWFDDDGLTAQYFDWPSNLNLPAECNYFGLADLGRVVPDSCCSPSKEKGPALDWKKEMFGATYSCAPAPAGTGAGASSGPYVRNFLRCVKGTPTFGEVCVPSEAALGTTYPMTNQTLIANSYVKAKTPQECGCGANGQFPSIYTTTGCIVAVTGFMLTPADQVTATTDRTATFVKVSGECGKMGWGKNKDKDKGDGTSVVGAVVGAAVGAAVGGAVR